MSIFVKIIKQIKWGEVSPSLYSDPAKGVIGIPLPPPRFAIALRGGERC
jgi:hypothetical protein